MIKESVAMYTLWTLFEVLSAAGALNGAKGVEQALMQQLELEKQQSNTVLYRGHPPTMEMEGHIERLRLVLNRAGVLLRVDVDLADNCITLAEIKEHFPDLFFDHENSNPRPESWSSYASRRLDVPVLFSFRNMDPDCLRQVSVMYASRHSERGSAPGDKLEQ